MSVISLADIKPQIVDVKIMAGYGAPITIPLKPLSYIEWQNVTLGLKLPKAEERKYVVEKDKPPVMALDYLDMEYQTAKLKYDNELRIRRLAIALAGGGMPDLQGKDLDEQADLVRDMDAGIMLALYGQLEGMALKRSAAWFRREAERPSENGTGHLPGDGLEPETVESPA